MIATLPSGAIVLGTWLAFAVMVGLLLAAVNWIVKKMGWEQVGETLLEDMPKFRYTISWPVMTGRGIKRVKQKIPEGTEARCPVCRRPMVEDK